MAKNKKNDQATLPLVKKEVAYRVCPLFSESAKGQAMVADKFKDFRKLKSENPMAKFGRTDGPFKGIIGATIPGLWHAHLNGDISIVYLVHGKNPTVIDLYGFFSHTTLGTGNPPSANAQRNISKRFSQQDFVDEKPPNVQKPTV